MKTPHPESRYSETMLADSKLYQKSRNTKVMKTQICFVKITSSKQKMLISICTLQTTKSIMKKNMMRLMRNAVKVQKIEMWKMLYW